MNLKNGIILMALATFFFVACSSDDDDTTPSNSNDNSKTALLTSGSWIGTDLLFNDTSVWDVFIDDCNKDDFQTFKADGTSVTDEGATKCDPNDAQTTPGTWKFINNETQIVLDNEDTANIKTLSGTELILSTTLGGEKVESRFKKK